MPKVLSKIKVKSLYGGIFVLAISEAIIAYVQSTYLNQFFNLSLISFIFIFTYFLTFFVINEYPNVIARFNNIKTALITLILKIISLLIFVFFSQSWLVFIGFILFTISFTLIFINFDIFLEAFTANSKTGKVRGIYFTMYNLGWLISPFLSGYLLEHYDFNLLFIIDIILTLVIAVILLAEFKEYKNHYLAKHFVMLQTFSHILKRISMRKIFYVSFVLHFFYAVMLIYTPIYLNQNIGLSWSQIGLIFTFMLIPFVVLQYPAGYVADKYIGEKEILTAGLLIMGISSLLIFFISSPSVIIWAIILFISRIGASLTEIMRETYFFKKVNEEDIDLINALRSITPLSYIVAPLIVGTLLLFLPLNYIFIILGFIILTGLYPALTLKDTK